MDRKFRSKSIAFKLTIAFVVSLVLQSVLLVSFMVAGGVMEQAEANQYRIFAEKVKGRRNNLENQMKNVWTNFSHHTCLLYTSPSPRDLSTSRMPSSA